MATEEEIELAEAVDRVLQSKSPKKLIVAGPGAGKTTLFRKLLETGSRETRREARTHLHQQSEGRP
jgi:predicted ATPase